jgi:TPP-dependent pyruvate/acetoin dehydrogenase alpha subunit
VGSLAPLGAYRSLMVMRRFEEAVGAATAAGEIHGEMHLGLGQEGVAVGLGPLLRRGDAVVSTHRPHLHALAHGVDPVEMLAELLERDGLCHGKGGHMHLFDAERDFMCTGIVGASAPLAAGYAYRQLASGGSGATVAVLGDGAMNQGGFFETANLASVWGLPLIFLCEDNGFGISVRRDDASAGPLEERGAPFGIPGVRCDGTDPTAVFQALEPAFRRARGRRGPALVVAECHRFSGHYEGDPDSYRTKDEKQLSGDLERDPVARLRRRLLDEGMEEAELERIEAAAGELVEGWVAAARDRPMPDRADLRKGVFA